VRTLLVVGLSFASTACLRTTEYHCSGDSSCGAGGACETSGYCSFIDTECTSGRRYNSSAGSLSGNCTTGGGTQEDANETPIDMNMPMTDTMPDTPIASCPIGYATITGGNAGHMYKKVTAAETWAMQESDCAATFPGKAHLAVPDDLTELTALDTLMGNGVTVYWVGVTDSMPPSTAEGTFYNVLGVAQTFLPWDPPAPDDAGPGEDCVEALQATHEFNDQRCNFTRPAVCECAP